MMKRRGEGFLIIYLPLFIKLTKLASETSLNLRAIYV